MAIDPYAPCPGGRDKKIKNCCPELIKDFEKIEEMIAGKQFAACLVHVQKLKENRPPCACLTSYECDLFKVLGLFEDWLPCAQEFAAREPDNLQAKVRLAEALFAMSESREAIAVMVDVLEKTDPQKMPYYVIDILSSFALNFAQEGASYRALPILKLLRNYLPQDQQIAAVMHECYSAERLPLLIRDLTFPRDWPTDHPLIEKISEAVVAAEMIQWKKSLAIFDEIVAQTNDLPQAEQARAVLLFWMVRNDEARAAFEKFIRCPNANPDDVLDAIRIIDFICDEEPFGELITLEKVAYTINDDNVAIEKMLSTSQLLVVPDQLLRENETSGRPRKGFRLLSKPLPPASETPTVSNSPNELALLFLYGKRTDRAARLEAEGVVADKKEEIDALLNRILGETLGSQEPGTPAGTISWLHSRVLFPVVVRPDAAIEPTSRKQLEIESVLNALVPQWLTQPMRILEGKTPEAVRQEATDSNSPAMLRLQAAVSMIESMFVDRDMQQAVVERLRSELQLAPPALLNLSCDESGNIDVEQIAKIPVSRWNRIDFSRVADTDLQPIFATASMLRMTTTMEQMAGEILKRAKQGEMIPLRAMAYDCLIQQGISAGNWEKVVELISVAKEESAEYKASDGHWNICEMILAVTQGDTNKLMTLIQHIQAEHSHEKAVMQEFFPLMVNLGLINPDGSPPRGAMMPEEPKQPGLWTPGGPDAGNSGPAAGGSGGSKLWIPD